MSLRFPSLLLALTLVWSAAACGASDVPQAARLASTPADYQRLRLGRGVDVAEDGMRTDGRPGNFEWWYFDAHLQDGSKLVIVFFTKPMTELDRPLTPFITIHLDRPDGTRIVREYAGDPEKFSAARERCDVRIDENFFRGDLRHYEIFAAIEDVEARLSLQSEVEAFRPATGHILFGDQEQDYFAWLAAVPRGAVRGQLTIAGHTTQIEGSGYHDHNWGTVGMHEVINNWYWARAELGEYTLITSNITSEAAYGHAEFPIFMLARGDRIIAADGQRNMRFARAGASIHPESGKPVDDRITSVYTDGARRYEATFERQRDLLVHRFITRLPWYKQVLAYLAGFDGAYHRFTGPVRLEIEEPGRRESRAGTAIWERMYFGENLE